jgi:ribosomal protein S18 acetylase RimI-like enzyme
MASPWQDNDAVPLTTRVATAADAPDLARLNAAFNDAHEAPEALAARLADPQRVETPFVAEAGGHIVGFAGLRIVPSVFYPDQHAELTELYVEPAYWRRGLGKALIAHVERLARERGASQLVVLTNPANLPAQALYRRMGFDHEDLALVKDLR